MQQPLGLRWSRWISLSIAALWMGCGNIDESDEKEPAESDTGLWDAGDTSSLSPGTCVELELNLHEGSGQALVTLETMSVTNEEVADYDFAMVNQMPEPPALFLGPSVTALNLGNDDSFEAVVEAPSDGYEADGDAPVIGTEWRTGGNGTDGHVVSGNIYVLKTADGKYGKISVTSAKQGIATIDAYLQADGSRALECTPAR